MDNGEQLEVIFVTSGVADGNGHVKLGVLPLASVSRIYLVVDIRVSGRLDDRYWFVAITDGEKWYEGVEIPGTLAYELQECDGAVISLDKIKEVAAPAIERYLTSEGLLLQ